MPVADGLRLWVRLTPKAANDSVDGWEQGADGARYLKARVRAIPNKGGANKALCLLIAKTFGVAKNTVSVSKGSKSRIKQVLIASTSKDIKDLIKLIEGH